MATNSYPANVASATATLSSDTRDIGTVATVGGSPGWVLMTVHDAAVNGSVTCEVTGADGKDVVVGTFRLEDGYGAWASQLPSSVGHIQSARIVASDGSTVGSATFAA